MTFDATQLDEFSGDVAQALFAAHPEWVSCARVELAEDGETLDLVVEVPSPFPQEGSPKLIVYTEDSEVTVSYDSYHSHFNWPPDDPDITLNPLTFIAAILNEEVAAVSGWNDGKWAGSWLHIKGEPIATPEKMSVMKTIRVRSWLGTLNQDLPTS